MESSENSNGVWGAIPQRSSIFSICKDCSALLICRMNIQILIEGASLSVKLDETYFGFFLSKWQAKVLVNGIVATLKKLGQPTPEIIGENHLADSAPKFDFRLTKM